MLAVCLKPLKYSVAASVTALALAGLFGVGPAMAGIRVYNPATGQNEAAPDDGMADAPTATPTDTSTIGGVRVPVVPEPTVAPQTKAEQQAAQRDDLLKQVQDLQNQMSRDWHNKQAGDAGAYRLGFAVAFVDTPSLAERRVYEGLQKLAKVKGLEFRVYRKYENYDNIKTFAQASKLKPPQWAKVTAPMGQMPADAGVETHFDDQNRIASALGVDRYPVVVYESPFGQRQKFYIMNTVERLMQTLTNVQRELEKQGH